MAVLWNNVQETTKCFSAEDWLTKSRVTQQWKTLQDWQEQQAYIQAALDVSGSPRGAGNSGWLILKFLLYTLSYLLIFLDDHVLF